MAQENLLVGITENKDKRGRCEMRPILHMTAERGWINDPNAPVYFNGKYHLYYQYNPDSVEWGNIHWGHCVSDDLIFWKEKNVVLKPDEYGMMFSGSAVADTDAALGFGRNALVYFYTAMNGKTGVQRIAVSNDGGETLIKGDTVVEQIEPENRDPKVFYHKESGAFIMALYLSGWEFALLRSTDCIHWEITQRFSEEGMWECPDLMRIGDTWVFWSADGYYMTGSFDGYRFTPDSKRLSAYYNTKLPYAAQSFANIQGRTVSVAWLRTRNENMPFRGMMSIPCELNIVNTPNGKRLSFAHVTELKKFEKPVAEGSEFDYNRNKPFKLTFTVPKDAAGTVKLEICGNMLEFEAEYHKAYTVSVVVDFGIAEIIAKEGTFYTAAELNGELNGTLKVCNDAGVSDVKLFVFGL